MLKVTKGIRENLFSEIGKFHFKYVEGREKINTLADHETIFEI